MASAKKIIEIKIGVSFILKAESGIRYSQQAKYICGTDKKIVFAKKQKIPKIYFFELIQLLVTAAAESLLA